MDIEAVACVHNLQYRFSTGLHILTLTLNLTLSLTLILTLDLSLTLILTVIHKNLQNKYLTCIRSVCLTYSLTKKILFYLINGCGTNIGNYDEKSAKRTRFRVLGGGFRRGRSCLL